MQYIVTVSQPERREQVIQDLQQQGVEIVKVFATLKKFFVIDVDQKTVKNLKQHKFIAQIEPNTEFKLQASRPIGTNSNWGLDRIDQRNLPLDNSYSFTLTGKNVDIYIQDTGIYSNHNELKGRVTHLWSAHAPQYEDDNGHGTHVAAIAAGKTFGVANQAHLYNVKSFSSAGSATNVDLLNGFDAILEHHKSKNNSRPSVVNMSFSGLKTTIINSAVEELVEAGIIVVCAAGNYNRPARNYSPASANGVITVAASTKSDEFAWFSNVSSNFGILSGNNLNNYGSVVDIIAPGVDILSAGLGSPSATAVLTGTSMAAPHVAGVCALYLEQNPDSTPENVLNWIVFNSTKNVINLTTTAKEEGTPNRLLYSKYVESEYDLEWITESGLIATVYEKNEFNFQFEAESKDSNGNVRVVEFLLVDGSLPPGLTLEADGTVLGNIEEVNQDTDFTFTIRASNRLNYLDRSFTIRVKNINQPPQWVTPRGKLADIRNNSYFSLQLEAQDVDNDSLAFELVPTEDVPQYYESFSWEESKLPPGLQLSPDGKISGAVVIGDLQQDKSFGFLVKVYETQSGGLYSVRDFSITVKTLYEPLHWVTTPGQLGEVYENTTFTFNVLAQSKDVSGKSNQIVYRYGNIPTSFTLYCPSQEQASEGIYTCSDCLCKEKDVIPEDTNGALIIGKSPNINSTEQEYEIEVSASDGIDFLTGTFSIVVKKTYETPNWLTPSGLLIEAVEGETVAFALDYEHALPVEVTLLNGTLPPGLSLTPSGEITGTIGTLQEDRVFEFTARLSDGISSVDRTFSISVKNVNNAPVWQTDLPNKETNLGITFDVLGTYIEGDNVEFKFDAYDPDEDPIVFSVGPTVPGQGGDLILEQLPDGLEVTPDGVLRGTILPAFNQTYIVASKKLCVLLNNQNNSTNISSVTLSELNVTNSLNMLLTKNDTQVTKTLDANLTVEQFVTEINNLGNAVNAELVNQSIIIQIDAGYTLTVENLTVPLFDQSYTITSKDFNSIVISNQQDLTITIVDEYSILDSNGNCDYSSKKTDILELTVDENTTIDSLETQINSLNSHITAVKKDNRLELNVEKGYIVEFSSNIANELFGEETINYVFDTTVKEYRFSIRATDGTDYSDKHFKMYVLDQPVGLKPTWLTPEFLGTFEESQNIYVQLKAVVYDENDKQQITYEDNGLPNGLRLLPTGELYGKIDHIFSEETFEFTVTALYYPDSNSSIFYETPKTFKLRVLNKESYVVPQWKTPAGSLGTIEVYEVSTYQLEAFDSLGSELKYRLVDGKLPPGLYLDSDGYIIGRVTSNAITNENYSYNFTVECRNKHNTSEQRTFSFDVVRYYNDHTNDNDPLNDLDPTHANICDVFFTITGDTRKDLVKNQEIIPEEYLYRSHDPYFGLNKNQEIFVASGINYNNLQSIWKSLSKDGSFYQPDWDNTTNKDLWYTENLDYMHPFVYLGDYGWSETIKDGKVIYETVYRYVLDPHAKAVGKVENPHWTGSLSTVPEAQYLEPQSIKNLRNQLISDLGFNKEDRLPNWIENASLTQIHNTALNVINITKNMISSVYWDQVTNLVHSVAYLEEFSNVREDIVFNLRINRLNVALDYVYKKLKDNKQLLKISEIQSLIFKLAEIANVSLESLDPQYMCLLPVAYVQPGQGSRVVALLKKQEVASVPVKIAIDRILVRKMNETTFWDDAFIEEVTFDNLNITTDTSSEYYRTGHNRTRFDLEDHRGEYIKFKSDK